MKDVPWRREDDDLREAVTSAAEEAEEQSCGAVRFGNSGWFVPLW